MAKYDITYSCGHADRITLFGPSRDRERKIEWYESQGMCTDCWKAKQESDRAKATEEAVTKAKEIGLTSLTGSPKQIAWAERIRATKIEQMESRSLGECESAPEGFIDTALAMFGRIAAITDASWWIEHREDSFLPYALIRQAVGSERDDKRAMALIDVAFREQEVAAELSTPDMQEAEIDAKAEATLRPEKPITETVAEITVTPNGNLIQFPERREDFRELVRFNLGYTWVDGRWQRLLKPTNGTPEDRAVELGCKLLAAGFPVRIFDPVLRERITSGDYEPECTRWIKAGTSGTYRGWLYVCWKRPDNFYDAAKRLPGSRYSKPDVVVPAEQFEQVLDFAESYGFKISEKAQMIIDQARVVRDAAITCKPTDLPTADAPAVPGRKPRKLAVPKNERVADEFLD